MTSQSFSEPASESISARTIDSDLHMAYSRSAFADFIAYVLVPFAVSTLAFVLLIWLRDPTDVAERWPVAFVASGVIGTYAFFLFVGHRRGTRLGIWRDLI